MSEYTPEDLEHRANFLDASGLRSTAEMLRDVAQAKREAKAGRECYYALTDFYAMVEGENPSLLEDDCNAIRAWSAIKAYEAAMKGST